MLPIRIRYHDTRYTEHHDCGHQSLRRQFAHFVLHNLKGTVEGPNVPSAVSLYGLASRMNGVPSISFANTLNLLLSGVRLAVDPTVA